MEQIAFVLGDEGQPSSSTNNLVGTIAKGVASIEPVVKHAARPGHTLVECRAANDRTHVS